MHIFLYEYITGGGLFGSDNRRLTSLRAEGEAMLAALAADFAAIEGVQLTVLRDARLTDFELPDCRFVDSHSAEEERALLERFARQANWTLLIAPEIERALADRVRWVEAIGGRLMSPGCEFVSLTSDKVRTGRQLAAAGVRVPESQVIETSEDGLVELPRDFHYPAVVKRIDGAGSLGTQLGTEPTQLVLDSFVPWMIERFCPGAPASVALLCGSNAVLPLPPFRQDLETGTFQYLGGSRLMDCQLAGRAVELAVRAVEALGRPTGYVGVDLVLGDNPSGADDFVIEVNPRLTTSYVGLRASTDDNLAEAMLAIAMGQHVALSFRDGPIEFTADGSVCPHA